MTRQSSHPSRQDLLLHLEQELPPHQAGPIRGHLQSCSKCRARSRQLQGAIDQLLSAHREEFGGEAADAAGPRALLRARLAQLSTLSEPRSARFAASHRFGWAAAVCALLAFALLLWCSAPPRPPAAVVATPNPALTPGATVAASRQAVCAQAGPNNKVVPVGLQQKVFQEYGLAGADPRAYEVDYLVTPALGGADDIHNLWPHSYSATVWNARVKDALENRLREMVCGGRLDLAEAQREISQNWIGAYKKYFRTEQPLSEHTQPSGGSALTSRP